MSSSARRAPAAPMGAIADSRRMRVLYLLHRALGRLSGGRAALEVYLFCAQPITAAAPATLRPQPDTIVRPVAAGDALTAAFPRPAAVIAQRFDSGAACYAATVKDQFAGHIWLHRTSYDEDAVRCRYWLPDARAVWDFDVFVAPPFRVGRTLARLWGATAAALHAEGVRWSFSRISAYNAGSVRAHERLGAVQVATGAFLTAGPLQLALFSRYPYCHFSARERQRPEFRLPAPAGQLEPAA